MRGLYRQSLVNGISTTFNDESIDSHAYDTIGNQTNHVANAATNTFTHNALNQMVGRGVPTAPQAFDPNGEAEADRLRAMSGDSLPAIQTS